LNHFGAVMAGLVPAPPCLLQTGEKDVDARVAGVGLRQTRRNRQPVAERGRVTVRLVAKAARMIGRFLGIGFIIGCKNRTIMI
jgi:hypothetical protein